MDVFLAYEDSLKMLRHVRQSPGLLLADALPALPPVGARELDAGLLERSLPSWLFPPHERPVALRVWDDAHRSRLASVRSVPNLARLGAGSYREVLTASGDPLVACGKRVAHVYVESAGLSVLSAARSLGFMESQGLISHDAALIRLSAFEMELCGTYARDPLSPQRCACTYGLDAVGTAREVGDYLAHVSRLHGLRLARRAAGYAADGSGSAAETLWYHLFCLPPRLGGLHFAGPLLNEELEWPDAVRAVCDHSKMRPDFYWPRYRLAIEYDSSWHEDPDALFEDRRRARDYELCGVAYLPVTARELASEGAARAFLAQLVSVAEPFEDGAFRRRMRQLLRDPDVAAARTLVLSQLLPPHARWADAS